MSILDDTNICNSCINISLRHGYVYFSVPKVASSTLKKTLANFELRDLPSVKLPAHPHFTHSPFVKPYQLPDLLLAEILQDDRMRKFTFVRNPYARILSAYLSKIVGSRKLKPGVLRALGHSRDDLHIDVSFEQFVDIIVTTETSKKNRHWMPMSYLLGYPRTQFGFMGRLENFDEDFAALQRYLGIDLTEQYQNPTRLVTNSAEALAHYYTPTLKAKIAEHYAEDFELGGYRPQRF